MKLMAISHVHLAFILGSILALYLQARGSATDVPLGMTESPAVPTSQSPTSQEPTKPSTALTTTVTQEKTTSATQTSAFQSASPTETSIFQSRSPTEMSASPSPSTLTPEVLTSFYVTTTTNTDQGSGILGKEQATANKDEICDENNKRIMLICFIIIGVLVFIGVLLLLVIVVLASKMSHLKRRHPSKRLPRSNGDFLSGNSLWPLGLETLQRTSNETPGTNPKTQGPGLERVSAEHEQFEEAGKKLAREISNRQKRQEMPPKSHDSTLARVEV
ncbi:protein EVI2A [Heteronotia binoei]|uniref:protein EVI2A n=1 Tax=Heteronotia binoei TaxID=13085 RepID=UPI00292EF180|nr:protein EVI2A [Heteronotia binoei]